MSLVSREGPEAFEGLQDASLQCHQISLQTTKENVQNGGFTGENKSFHIPIINSVKTFSRHHE